MNELVPSQAKSLTQPRTLEGLLGTQNIRQRFDDILGKKAAGFVSSILSAVNQNQELRKADPMTVVSAAAVAASLDLPINPSLGFAHIVPYKNRAQFQMGWRGYVQLAQRSGQYKTINVAIVHEGELKRINKFTGEMEFDEDGKTSDKIIGYVAYFKLLNGFEKYLYMTLGEAQAHGKRYSRSFENENSRWQQDFDLMALKTVIKLLLNRWGVLSVDMQTAIHADQAVIKESGEYEYVDAAEEEAKPLDTSEFDNAISTLNVDQGKMDKFLSDIARANNLTIEQVKVEAVGKDRLGKSNFDEFWKHFCKWAGTSAPTPNIATGEGEPEKPKAEPGDKKKIDCPNTKVPVAKTYCDKGCNSRQGCPAWE